MNRIGVPGSIRGSFQGTARTFQASLQSQPWLILAALVTIYIVLGILYESYVHPITILSTLPSAGVGAILALIISRTEFSIMALIGVILLIGIVKKNAIMMIDFALDAGTKTREKLQGGHIRGMPDSFPADHDDDHGGTAWCDTTHAQHRGRGRIASTAGYFHCRRTDREPDAYIIHNAGRLFIP